MAVQVDDATASYAEPSNDSSASTSIAGGPTRSSPRSPLTIHPDLFGQIGVHIGNKKG
jgi:hypothetical protein